MVFHLLFLCAKSGGKGEKGVDKVEAEGAGNDWGQGHSGGHLIDLIYLISEIFDISDISDIFVRRWLRAEPDADEVGPEADEAKVDQDGDCCKDVVGCLGSFGYLL